jgi:hypothetical protein
VSFLINYYVDDGFFYLKIANNFANGLGSSFDGINPTNGYHPAWFLMLSFCYFIVSLITKNPSPELLMRLNCVIHFILLILIYYFSFKAYKLLIKDYLFYKWLLLSVLLLVPFATRNFGMEVHTVPVLLAAYLWIKAKEFNSGKNYLNWKIFIFIFLGLSRTENFFTIIPVLILYEVLSNGRNHLIKRILIYSLPCAAAFLLYLFSNLIYFGHLFTISSTIKNTFPDIILIDNIKLMILNISSETFAFFNFVFFIGTVIVLVPRFIIERKRQSISKLTVLLLVLSFGYVLYILLNLCFNKEALREWYFSGTVYISAVTLSTIIEKSKIEIEAFAIAVICVFMFYFYHSRVTNTRNNFAYEYAKEIKNHVAPNETIFQIDYSGFVGFFSERKVINGDGLVNSFEYNDYVKRNALPEYLKKYNVDYYSTYAANIDSLSEKVFDYSYDPYHGQQMNFPLGRVKYQRNKISGSYFNSRAFSWFLIHF